MEPLRVLVTIPKGKIRDTFIPPHLQERLEKETIVRWNPMDRNFTEDELAEYVQDAQVCLTGWGSPLFTDQVLDRAKDLKVIAHTGGTVSPVAREAVYQRGNIRVLSGNELYAESVGESVIAYALTALRDIPKYTNMTQEKGWSDPDWYTEGLIGQKFGMVGFGATSRYTAEFLRPFHVELLINSSHLTDEEAKKYGGRKASIEEIFSTCKVVSLHMSKTPKTFHQVNKALLDRLQDGALLINTARGAVIDEQALAEALKENRFKAVLDVYEEEPLPMESPLRHMENAILIPHMGGPTIDRRQAVTSELLNETRRILEKGGDSYLEIDEASALRMTR